MTRVFVVAGGLAGLAGAALWLLDSTAELIAWEVVLLIVVVAMIRGIPSSGRERVVPLFGDVDEEGPHPPRSVSSYELAAVHAFSETPGADRRLRRMMTQIAGHRRRARPSSDANRQMERLLSEDPMRPLSREQIERIVDQLEGM